MNKNIDFCGNGHCEFFDGDMQLNVSPTDGDAVLFDLSLAGKDESTGLVLNKVQCMQLIKVLLFRFNNLNKGRLK